MEPIRDISWMAQKAFGTLERFELDSWSVLAVKGTTGSTSSGKTYKYRLLFFKKHETRPVYAVNLEASILGEWVISEQHDTAHSIIHRLSAPITYDEFRIMALERAISFLDEQKTPIKIKNSAKDTKGKHR